MQTVEAIVDSTGKVKILNGVKLPKNRRALLTILDDEPKADVSKKEKLLQAFKKAQEANLFKEIKDPVEWQRKLRDEWD